MGHLQPSRAIPSDGSLSPDSVRARRMLVTAELGQSTKSLRERNTMRRGGRSFSAGPQVRGSTSIRQNDLPHYLINATNFVLAFHRLIGPGRLPD